MARFLNGITQFFREVKVELGKVAWSTPQEIVRSAMVVLIGTFLFTAYIFVVDAVLIKFLNVVIK